MMGRQGPFEIITALSVPMLGLGRQRVLLSIFWQASTMPRLSINSKGQRLLANTAMAVFLDFMAEIKCFIGGNMLNKTLMGRYFNSRGLAAGCF